MFLNTCIWCLFSNFNKQFANTTCKWDITSSCVLMCLCVTASVCVHCVPQCDLCTWRTILAGEGAWCEESIQEMVWSWYIHAHLMQTEFSETLFTSVTITFRPFPRSCSTTTQLLIQPWHISWAGRIEKRRAEGLKWSRAGRVMRVQKDRHVWLLPYFIICTCHSEQRGGGPATRELRHCVIDRNSAQSLKSKTCSHTLIVEAVKSGQFSLNELQNNLI